MPYIKQELRKPLDAVIIGKIPTTAGELNYTLTRMVLEYLGNNPDYQCFNDVLGVLTAMQHEIYRRLIAPYENLKAKENGDLF